MRIAILVIFNCRGKRDKVQCLPKMSVLQSNTFDRYCTQLCSVQIHGILSYHSKFFNGHSLGHAYSAGWVKEQYHFGVIIRQHQKSFYVPFRSVVVNQRDKCKCFIGNNNGNCSLPVLYKSSLYFNHFFW